MITDNSIKELHEFLNNYSEEVQRVSIELHSLICTALPKIGFGVDVPAKIIAYNYGNKYADMICAVIPSQRGVKLSFNRGVQFKDVKKILNGAGKITRYIQINKLESLDEQTIIEYILQAENLYRRIKH